MSSPLLTSNTRTVRRVAPPDAPCESTLAMVDEASVLLVDVDQPVVALALPFVGAIHVWAPSDIARTENGHEMIMPRVVETLAAFLHKREDESVRAGELVTLACSVLRGVREVRQLLPRGDSARDVRWWVTDAGKPMLVVADGDSLGDSVDVESVRILDRLAEFVSDRDFAKALAACTEAIRGADDDLAAAERSLYRHAAPQPVTVALIGTTPRLTDRLSSPAQRALAHRTVPTPRRADTARALPSPHDSHAVVPAVVGEYATRIFAGVRAAVLRRRAKLDAAASSKTRHATPQKPTTKPARLSSRKRAVVLAIVVAIFVMTGGFLWPEPGETSAGKRDVSMSKTSGALPPGLGKPPENATPAGSEPRAEPAEAGEQTTGGEGDVITVDPGTASRFRSSPEKGGNDLVIVTMALLQAAQNCEDHGTCEAVLIDTSLASQAPSEGLVELVDEYGGIAVLTLTPTEQPPLTVVIEKRNDRWMIREIFAKGG